MFKLSHVANEVGIMLIASKHGHELGKFKSRQYTFLSDSVKNVEGKYFLMLNRFHVSARRLLTMQSTSHVNTLHADDGIASMSKTDAVDKLQSAKGKESRLRVCDGDGTEVDNLKRRWQTSRKYNEQPC